MKVHADVNFCLHFFFFVLERRKYEQKCSQVSGKRLSTNVFNFLAKNFKVPQRLSER